MSKITIAGTGLSKVALIVGNMTESEAHAKDPLRSFPATWMVPRGTRDHYLRISLNAQKGEDSTAAWEQALYLCRRRGIKVIMPVGTVATAHTKSLGLPAADPSKTVGATVFNGEFHVTPLVSARHGGKRAFRSYMWHQVQAGFIERARALAAGQLSHAKSHTPELELFRAYDQILHLYKSGKQFSLDLETTAGTAETARISAMGIACLSEGVCVSIPWDSYNSIMYGPQPGLCHPLLQQLVLKLIANAPAIFHNGAFDVSMLMGHGIAVHPHWDDTILAHRVLYPDLYHNLQFCVNQYKIASPWKLLFDQERKRRKENPDDWAETEPTALHLYNGQDSGETDELWSELSPRLEIAHAGRGQYAQLKFLSLWAADAARLGVRIDRPRVEALRTQVRRKIWALHRDWRKTVGHVRFSGPGSTKQINTLFFETLQAPIVARSATTDKPALGSSVLLEYDNLKGAPALADTAFLLFRIRKASKSYIAFLRPLGATDRVYPRPNIIGTKGTRMSYSDPNLQQWSKAKTIKQARTGKEFELAPPLRTVVCPDEGMVMWEFDANALEARLVAYAANIPLWLEWLANGVDMHSEHVKQMFGIKNFDRKKDPQRLRDITKTLTYARFYNDKASVGQVLRTLKPSMPDLTEGRLKEIFRLFDVARPEVVAWQHQVREFVMEHGYAQTGMGDWRQIQEPRRPDLNQSYSFTIQSTAGALMNTNMLKLIPKLQAFEGSRILGQVHDALLGQSRPEHLAEVFSIVKSTMESPVDIWNHKGVVIPFDGGVGLSWADAKHPLDKFLNSHS